MKNTLAHVDNSFSYPTSRASSRFRSNCQHAIGLGLLSVLLTACSIKVPITQHYKLTQFSAEKVSATHSEKTLFISPTEAVAGYQSEQMQYSTKPFTFNSFTKNGWFSPPASMIYPLIIQSLQHSGYFEAIGSGTYTNKADYRLDTQLIELQQDFTKKPSMLQIKMKAMVTRITDNQLISSHTFSQQIPCPQNTPYGGALAANQAMRGLTKAITHFTIQSVKGHQ